MPLHNKVVWQDGMFIAPQHFQHNDAYHEELLHFRLNALGAHGWGLTELKIDESALKNGDFVLTKCAGVFEEGPAFDISSIDEAPAKRPLGEYFQESLNLLEVHLAVPGLNDKGGNCWIGRSEDARNPRFAAEKFSDRHDENVGGKKRDLFVAKKRLTLRFCGKNAAGQSLGDSLEGYTHLKIAEIVKSKADTFVLQENYIPPCLHVSVSAYLTAILNGLHEMMVGKSRDLSEKRRAKNNDVVEFSTFDVENYWLLHTVNSYIPALAHYRNVKSCHPETVYGALSQLAGELTTFTTTDRPENLPDYQHKDLTHSFDTLNTKIRNFISIVIPDTCTPIKLDTEKYPWRFALIENDKKFDTEAFYLAVSAAMPPKLLVKEVREKIKIAVLDDIESVVNHALPSRLVPVHEEHPPAAISVKVGFQYFRLPSEEPYWKKVRSLKTLALYLPKGFERLHLELMSVKTVAVKTETEEEES